MTLVVVVAVTEVIEVGVVVTVVEIGVSRQVQRDFTKDVAPDLKALNFADRVSGACRFRFAFLVTVTVVTVVAVPVAVTVSVSVMVGVTVDVEVVVTGRSVALNGVQQSTYV